VIDLDEDADEAAQRKQEAQEVWEGQEKQENDNGEDPEFIKDKCRYPEEDEEDEEMFVVTELGDSDDLNEDDAYSGGEKDSDQEPEMWMTAGKRKAVAIQEQGERPQSAESSSRVSRSKASSLSAKSTRSSGQSRRAVDSSVSSPGLAFEEDEAPPAAPLRFYEDEEDDLIVQEDEYVWLDDLDRASALERVDELGDTMIYPPLPPGWEVMGHNAKDWDFYFHPTKRLITWSRPYLMPAKRAPLKMMSPSDTIPEQMRGTRAQVMAATQKALLMGEAGARDPMVSQTLAEKVEVDLDLPFDGMPPPNIHKVPFGVIRFRNSDRKHIGVQEHTKADCSKRPLWMNELKDKNTVQHEVQPYGKSPILFLHQVLTREFKMSPTYVMELSGESGLIYKTSVKLGGRVVASALGANKRSSKRAAAIASIQAIKPEALPFLNLLKEERHISKGSSTDLEIPVTHPDVIRRCGDKRKKPVQLLYDYVSRKNVNVEWKVNCFRDVGGTSARYFEVTGTLGQYTFSRTSLDKTDAKNLVAQQILASLHPHLSTYAEMERFYSINVHEWERATRDSYVGPNKEVLNRLMTQMAAAFPVGMDAQGEMGSLLPLPNGTYVLKRDMDQETDDSRFYSEVHIERSRSDRKTMEHHDGGAGGGGGGGGRGGRNSGGDRKPFLKHQGGGAGHRDGHRGGSHGGGAGAGRRRDSGGRNKRY